MNERDLFLSALEIEDPKARQAHLHAACADDSELLSRVEALLASHESQSQFLNTPVVEQISDDPGKAHDPTVVCDDSLSEGQQLPNTAESASDESDTILQDKEDLSSEILPGYLEPSSRPDSVGRLGHYEILEVIGKGAFGTVLKAFDEKLQRVVAIKVLAPEMAATSPARKRFLREARTSAAVRHDNVVSIFAVEDEPTPYIVMEYIPGKTLQQRLDEQGPLALDNVLLIGKQIADGLAAAHEQKLIHRDIKPGNILLENSVNAHVKITDFGLARTADDASMTQSGMIAGTPLYMAPEQALGQKLDQRADLFSFGSVLYQMISGRPPFRASSTVAVLKRVADDMPRPIQEIIPETPDWLCKLIGNLHAKNPDERYGSAKEVSDLLAKCLDDVQAGRVPRLDDPDGTLVFSGKATPSTDIPQNSKKTITQFLVIAVVLLFAFGLSEMTGLTSMTPFSKRRPEFQPAEVASVGNEVADPAASFEPAHTEKKKENVSPPPLAKAPFDSEQAKAHQRAWADYLGVPIEKEIVLGQDNKGSDVKLTMVLVPPGEFLMGTNPVEIAKLIEERKAEKNNAKTLMLKMEGPQHFVRITKPFWMSKYEFQTGQFRRFAESTGYKTDAETNGKGGFKVVSGKLTRQPDVNWDMVNSTKFDKGPVVNVSYNDALACCTWLSNQDSELTFSLPTEAQWEYACRAGTTTPWYGCESAEELEQYAWFKTNSKWINRGGRLKPNAFGLHDMHGNLWEWCLDWMSGIYRDSQSDDPVRLEDVEHPLRVNRGGSFLNSAKLNRSAKRGGASPESCMFDRGFRVVAAITKDVTPGED